MAVYTTESVSFIHSFIHSELKMSTGFGGAVFEDCGQTDITRDTELWGNQLDYYISSAE